MEERSSRWTLKEEEVDEKRPKWFEWAISQTPISNHVKVKGCNIHYLCWGSQSTDKPGILFVHGGAAHAHWWSFIAPFFAQDRLVAAIDLSGMGDSECRKEYTSKQRVAEMAAVIIDAGLGDKPVIVGHSFGGYMTTCFGHHHGSNLSGVVNVDSFVRPSRQEAKFGGNLGRPKPYFPDKNTIVRRYRLSPYQPCENEYLVKYIAGHSVIKEEAGWTWKYDDNVRYQVNREEPFADYLRQLVCPKVLIYGAESMFLNDETLAYTSVQYGDGDAIISVPASGHHLMLDQPIAFVTGLRAILAGWNV